MDGNLGNATLEKYRKIVVHLAAQKAYDKDSEKEGELFYKLQGGFMKYMGGNSDPMFSAYLHEVQKYYNQVKHQKSRVA